MLAFNERVFIVLMLELRDVSKSFDSGVSFAVKAVSFSLKSGEILVLLGSSGSGKSTVLQLVNGLVSCSEGEVLFNNKTLQEYDLVKLRRRMGYVIQAGGLFPHLSVWENISVILKLEGVARKKRMKRAKELLELVNLQPDEYSDRFPHELSGGEAQRIGVARALAMDPEILLMDEPFGALDAVTRENLQDEILALNKKLGKTIIFVTHDIFEALKIADRIAVMDKGKLLQIDTPQKIASNPDEGFVASLFEKPVEQLQVFSDSL